MASVRFSRTGGPVNTRRATLGLVGVAVLGLGTFVAPSAGADPRPDRDLPGIITFQRFDDNGQFQLWVANADLSNQRQITSGPYTSGFATWKPDGTRLAFDSNRSDPDLTDDGGPNDVFTTNPDGTGVVQVTDFGGFSGDPDWSPDGKWLTFESDLGDHPDKQGIYVSRPDGSQLRRVTTLPEGYEFDIAPQFSPDGERIVFTRYRLDDEGNETSALHIVNTDGTNETRLDPTAEVNPGDANWSPNGKTLVFEAYGPDGPNFGNIFTIRSNGKQLRNRTNNDPDHQGASDPVYSPNGRLIMFLKGEGFNIDDGLDPVVALATMKKNGQDAAFVSDSPGFATQEHQPDWIQAPRLAAGATKSLSTGRQAAPSATFSARRDVYSSVR